MSPKARLEFSLPEEATDFFYAKNGIAFSIAIEDISNLFRKYRKYHEFKSKAAAKFFDQLDEEFLQILRDLPEER